jgi:hypothetical protein
VEAAAGGWRLEAANWLVSERVRFSPLSPPALQIPPASPLGSYSPPGGGGNARISWACMQHALMHALMHAACTLMRAPSCVPVVTLLYEPYQAMA